MPYQPLLCRPSCAAGPLKSACMCMCVVRLLAPLLHTKPTREQLVQRLLPLVVAHAAQARVAACGWSMQCSRQSAMEKPISDGADA